MSAGAKRGLVAGRGDCARLLGRWVTTALGVGFIAFAASAKAQEKKDPPPLDINEIQPAGQARSAPPGSQDQPKQDKPEEEVKSADDGPAYVVARFLMEYKTEHPLHPSLDEIADWKVRLGVTPEGYVAPREGLPSVEVRIGDVREGTGGTFRWSGLGAVARGVVEALNARGLVGIYVQWHPEDIDPNTGTDKREGKRSELRMIIWTGKIDQVRTVASGERLRKQIETDPASRINNPDPVHDRIRVQSPLQQGDLLRKDTLDNYVARLNRHPGRRIDVALAPGDTSESVVLDYMVAESKPWAVYAQLSNTGTETTSEWRERFGFVHNQVSGHDDILRVDYTTAGFDASHALLASYEFPLLSDRIRARGYVSYTEFTASDVGNTTDDFTGQTVSVGGEISATIWQHREAFLDVYAGLRWKTEKIEETGGTTGDENFYFPYVGMRFERVTEIASTFLDLGIEAQWDALSQIDDRDLQDLGRPEVNASWEILKFSGEQSIYLEPLLNPAAYRGEIDKGPTTLAHEVVAMIRGQWAFGYRVIASEEEVAGGMFSVRGYPESIIAADSMVMGTLEYRFHLPRALGVSEQPGMLRGKRVGLFGDDFRWQPQQTFGRADWDWIFKAFIDAARSHNSEGASITEEDFTLVGAGIGTELQFKRNFAMRIDWGIALQDVDDPANEVDAGDSEVHFMVMVLY
jgi:hemolysin activation/secretion protein